MKRKQYKVVFRGELGEAITEGKVVPFSYIYFMESKKLEKVQQLVHVYQFQVETTTNNWFDETDVIDVLIIIVEVIPLVKQVWFGLVDLWNTIFNPKDETEKEAIQAVKDLEKE